VSADARTGELVIVDYGVGNLRNVYKAVEAAGGQPRVVNRPEAVGDAAGVILPGVGAFGDAAANLRAAGFESPLKEAAAGGKPLLGICVGMQLLFDESEEMAAHLPMGVHPGLGLLPGRVLRFSNDVSGPDGRPLKVPEIGWNQLHHDGADPLLQGVADGAYAYFVHSYYCRPESESDTLASTDYGITYASVVRRGNLWGIQCHPEKSQQVGLAILRNFVKVVNEWA
jgi:imidazole glycerol-phosphate synthase subunit HisH